MSSFNRRFALLGLISATAACQFRPVHGPGGSGEVLRNRIQVAEPNSRLDFELVARLEDRLGTGSEYLLDYTLTLAGDAIAIDGAENINRINIIGTLAFAVRNAATGAVVQQDSVNTFTAYATTGTPVATVSARRDAEDRLMVALADQLVTRLIAGAPTWT